MTKMIQKSVILTVVLGLLLAAAAPSAMAQDKCHRRDYTSSRYDNDDYRRDRYDNDDYRRDRYRNDYYNPSHDWQSSRAHGGGRWHRRVGWRVDRRRKGRGDWRGNWWSRRLYLSPAESQ